MFKRKTENDCLESLSKTKRIGLIGEKAAAAFLTENGCRILARNYTVGKNEIDIIAEDKEHFIFCEVKARIQKYGVPSPYGRPASAVTKEKQQNVIAAAASFAARHRNAGKRFRFDVIEVYLDENEAVSHIHHIPNAFTR